MSKPFCFNAPAIREQGSLSFTGAVGSEIVQAALGGEVLLQGPIQASLEFTWRAGDVDFSGKAGGKWRLECSRCLADVWAGYAVKLEGMLTPEGGIVDLTEEVRQALVLALPIQSLCKSDCKGLCAKCRADLNVKDCGCAVVPK